MRRSKILGFAAALALTLAMFPAMAAASQGFAADEYPASVYGLANGNQTLKLAHGVMECGTPSVAGSLAAASGTLVTEVGKADCSRFGSTAPVEMNGCGYEFHPSSATFGIGPSKCGPIKIAISGCKISIGSQSGLPATYTNSGVGSKAVVTANVGTSALKYTQESTGGCKSGTYFDGGYEGYWGMQAKNAGGAATGLRVEDIAVGAYLTGKESETPSEQPKFEAENYPAQFLGDQASGFNKSLVFSGTPGGTMLSCESVRLVSGLTASTNSLAVNPQYGGCMSVGFFTTVKMNSCRYQLDVLNAGAPYVGTFGVICTTPGDAIDISSSACSVKIGAQTGLSGVGFTNVGEGSERGVEVEFNVSGIQYSVQKKNFLCATPAGSFSNGSLAGPVTMRGLK